MRKSRTEGYQANGLHEASLNTKRRGTTPMPIGSTRDQKASSREIESATEVPADEVHGKDHEIQDEKIHDVSEKNDTMHNPAMEIGKSYVVTEDKKKEETVNQ